MEVEVREEVAREAVSLEKEKKATEVLAAEVPELVPMCFAEIDHDGVQRAHRCPRPQ